MGEDDAVVPGLVGGRLLKATQEASLASSSGHWPSTTLKVEELHQEVCIHRSPVYCVNKATRLY
jgi:hypothetical protein